MFAVIETGGKQYFVSVGKKLKIEKLDAKKGTEFIFDKVLLVFENGNDVNLGAPYIKNTTVTAKILRQGKRKKITIERFRPKKRQHKKKGHRQHYTEVEIKEIKIK